MDTIEVRNEHYRYKVTGQTNTDQSGAFSGPGLGFKVPVPVFQELGLNDSPDPTQAVSRYRRSAVSRKAVLNLAHALGKADSPFCRCKHSAGKHVLEATEAR